ncbi:MAG: glycoside hydrolase family 3 protein, partial [Calditrichaeota bacterium]|nr:glycoside hydrolase family 3 protein [Calditrichota bacterium]
MKYSLTLQMLILLIASSFSRTIDDRVNTLLNQMTMEEKIEQLHKEGGFNTADNTRLGIPGFQMADGPHGVRDGLATCFPVGIAMAASWDVDLITRIGVAMGKEFRGKGKNQALGPCMDLCRDPRNGRSPESGGEDPYLCA